MPQKITDIVSIWDGLPRGDVLYLLTGSDQLTEERAPHAILIEYTTKPRAVVTLDWTAKDLAADPYGTGVLVMGLEGQIARFSDGRVENLPSISGLPVPSQRGTLLYLGRIGSQLMACGGNQQIYRYSESGHWIRYEEGLMRPEDGGLSQFEFIVGDDDNGLYTGGARGEAWYRSDQKWLQLDMPTNVRLTSACRGPDGKWWIAGQLGTLMRGLGNSWELLNLNEDIPYFWDLVFFQDELFLATDRVLYHRADDEIEPVNFGNDALFQGTMPYSFSRLAVKEDRLYSFGSKDVLTFDGDRWQRII